ncbi:MAG: PhoX family protein, partial [Croceitalea sp.]|nr:PhoX family protein [Croceitalea sp.]
MKLNFIFFFLLTLSINGQDIGDFISIQPQVQSTDFIIPSSHTFQKIIIQDEPLTQGGNMPSTHDFTGYVPINGSSENGYLSINSETVPGAVSILDINFNAVSKLWNTTLSQAIDFSSVVGTIANCSGTVTPWNTIISCEEYTSIELQAQIGTPLDLNGDGYHDMGWAVEIDPASKIVIGKRWALGNFKHENLVIHQNQRTAYQGADNVIGAGFLYKFVADNPQDLSSGNLYVYTGPKSGNGNWVLLNNTTPEERNTTEQQSYAVGATNFEGIEDVEIGPDGLIYFAVKNEGIIYRFQDSDPISGTAVNNMEIFVGNTSYEIEHAAGSSLVDWGFGIDNLAFDGVGNLWAFQDGGNNYIWVVKNGHTQANPQVEIFGSTPLGAEPTGITFSPDYRFLFMSIQHPFNNNDVTTQTDAAGNEIGFDKATTLVIALNGNLGSSTESVWYLDADGDGYAVEPTVMSVNSPGPGYTTTVLPITDCNDNDANVFEETTWYLDADGDGYAVSSLESCNSPGNGYVNTVLPIGDC